jgi:spore coat polysaccharide biosynthesis predicted glycosyltransferase SpsG/SAM-dependent methyltransferase
MLQILADGGPQTGFGHIGRCLAIAEELGDHAAFSVDDETAARFIAISGGRVRIAAGAPVVLIDRRAPTSVQEVRDLRRRGQRVVLLDDMGSGRTEADLVVDPPTAAFWPPTPAPRLSGFEHVLLRREVRDATRVPRRVPAEDAPLPGGVLLAMGGSDPAAATPVLAAALAAAGIEATAVLGPGYHGLRPDVGGLLERPDLFVAALAGATLFVASYGHALLEAAHLGVPTIAVVLRREQRVHAEAFCANGTAILLDMTDQLRPVALAALVGELLAAEDRRSRLAERGRALVDGNGAVRVAAAIRKLAGPARNPPRSSGSVDHSGPILAQRGDARVIDCETCGWAHLDPIPDADELSRMYKDTYYQDHYPGWLQKDRSEQAYWDLEHADKLSDWCDLLGRERATLLDVGCSGGLLLEFAIRRGWTGVGIEPSRAAVEEARSHGLDVRAGVYQEVPVEPASVDVVHCKLVGEHLPDPRAFLGWVASVLRPGGIVCMHVPNDFNPLQLAARDALGKEDWWVAPPFHINYFTFESLERLLASPGFEPVRRDTTFPVEWFLLMGEDYVGDAELGASVHRRRMALETALERLALRRPLHQHLAARGLGREAIVHARLRA